MWESLVHGEEGEQSMFYFHICQLVFSLVITAEGYQRARVNFLFLHASASVFKVQITLILGGKKTRKTLKKREQRSFAKCCDDTRTGAPSFHLRACSRARPRLKTPTRSSRSKALPICYLSRRGNLAPLYSAAANGLLTSPQGDEVKNTCEDVRSEHSLFAREGTFTAAD